MPVSEIAPTLPQVIISVIIALVANFLLSYFKEKGKALATKSDLDELTKVVEGVKLENSKQLENVRLVNGKEIEELKRDLNKTVELYNEEKVACLEFYAQINSWMWTCNGIQLHEYNQTNYLEINQKILANQDAYTKTNIAWSKVDLLIDDDNLMMLGHQSIIDVLKFHFYIQDILKKILWNLSSQKMYNSIFFKDGKYQTPPEEIAKFNIAEMKILKNELEQIFQDKLKQKNIEFAAPIKALHEFKIAAKNYLRT